MGPPFLLNPDYALEKNRREEHFPKSGLNVDNGF